MKINRYDNNLTKIDCPACNAEIDFNQSIPYLGSQCKATHIFEKLRIQRCIKCEFSFAYPYIPPEDLEKFYQEEYIFSLSNLNTRKNYYPERVISQIALVKMFLDISSDDYLIDIGCDFGDSFYVANRLLNVCRYIAIEPNPSAKCNLNKLGAEVIPQMFGADAIRDLGGGRKGKLIIASNVLEHYNANEVENFIKNISQVIEHEGILLIEVPFDDLLENPQNRYDDIPHLSFFSIASLELILRRNGFSILFSNYAGQKRNDWFNKYSAVVKKEKLKSNKMFVKIQRKILSSRFKNAVKKIINPSTYFLKQKEAYLLLLSDYFQYGPKREFIRIIARPVGLMNKDSPKV